MWILVYIMISHGEPYSVRVGEPYSTMTECSLAREELSYSVGRGAGYFLPNTQAVCVYTVLEND